MNKFQLRTVIVAIAAVLLSSCASIVSDSNYAVNITSQPSNANFKIIDEHGVVVYTGKTPAVVNLESGAGFFQSAKYQVVFTKKGYEDRVMTLKSSIDGWYFGNLLLGGFLGMLVIDPVTGAMWKLPPHISNELTNDTTAKVDNGNSFSVALLEHVPAALHKSLIALN